jgi:hypothetical protein
MTTTRTTPISVHGLTKQFGRLPAVEALTFESGRDTSPGFLAPTAPARPPPCACCSGWYAPPPAPP